MENWFEQLKKNRHKFILYSVIYAVACSIIYYIHYKVKLGGTIHIIYILPLTGGMFFMLLGGDYLSGYRSELVQLTNLSRILFIQCDPPRLINCIEPSLSEMKKQRRYTDLQFKLQIEFLLASAYLFNGNPETANSIFANSYKSISRISKINAFLYTAFIIVSYLSVNDIKNASYYFTYYNKLDMTGLKTVYYEIHQLGHKIFNILLSNSQSDPHLLIGLYNELLIKLNAHYLVCVEKLIHWQLANIYINENNTAQAVFHLKEIVCDDNSLAITKLAKKSLNNMNVEFSVEPAKEFKPFFKPIPFFIYLIILLGILLPLFYIVDIFL